MTLRENIIQLKKQSKSYNQISQELNCSKGVISYHLNESVKKKTMKRNKQWRRKNTLATKIHSFLFPNSRKRKLYKIKTKSFSVEEFMEKINNNPRCYLTGETIDLNNAASYHLDHIIPISKGGNSTLENCGLLTKNANLFKNTMLIDEIYELCETILKNKKMVVGGGLEPKPLSGYKPPVLPLN